MRTSLLPNYSFFFAILLHNAFCVFVLALALARILVMHWTGENEGLCSLFLSYNERVEDDKIVLSLVV